MTTHHFTLGVKALGYEPGTRVVIVEEGGEITRMEFNFVQPSKEGGQSLFFSDIIDPRLQASNVPIIPPSETMSLQEGALTVDLIRERLPEYPLEPDNPALRVAAAMDWLRSSEELLASKLFPGEGVWWPPEADWLAPEAKGNVWIGPAKTKSPPE